MFRKTVLIIILALKISTGHCGECIVKRLAQNNGFHRDVVTEIVLIGVSSSPLNCKFMLIEFIPSGLYVDIYQIINIGKAKIYSASKIDIEKPEYASHSHEIYVWQNFTMNSSQSTTVTITLPIHLRYHRPSSDRSVTVLLEDPRIFAQCSGSDFVFQRVEGTSAYSPCDANNISSLCEWRELHCTSKSDTQRLEFTVPVGNPDHMIYLVSITLIVTFFGSIIIIYFTCTANNLLPPRKPAQPTISPIKVNNSTNLNNRPLQNNSARTSSNQNKSNDNTLKKHGANTPPESPLKSKNSQNTGESEKRSKPGVQDGDLNYPVTNGKDSYSLRKRASHEGKSK